jgi:hypothetical protein
MTWFTIMRRLFIFYLLCIAFLAVACDKKEPVTPDKPTPTVDPPTPQVVKVTGVKLDKTEATLMVGETVQLSATVEPANATEKSISWKTDDSSIANVDGKGLVTAVKGGSTTISVITKDGNMTAKFTITVKEPLSLKVYHSGKEVGDSLIYRLESTPGDSISFEVFDNATGAFVDADNLQVSSSSKEVATYSGHKGGSGFVKAVSDGLSTLTFSWGDERLHSIILKVLPKPTEFGVFYAHAGTGTDPIAKDREIVEGALLRFNSPFFNVYYLDLYDLTNRSQILHDNLITGESSDPDIASVVVNTGSFSYTWGIYSHNAGTATITLGYGEFRRSFVAKVTEYKLYYNGKEAGNSNIEYYMGTNQGDVLKFSLFDETTKSFLKTKDWKLNIIFGSTHVDVSYTDTECVLKAKSAGMISINAIDTSDGQEFLVRNFAIFVRGN